MNQEVKRSLSKATDRAKLVLIIVVTAVLSSGAMFTYWLHTDNDRLETERAQLETRVQELQGQSNVLQADNIYLKEQALKENVFLTDRPAVK